MARCRRAAPRRRCRLAGQLLDECRSGSNGHSKTARGPDTQPAKECLLVVRARTSVRATGRVTGHKTRSVFERYNIMRECDLVEAAKKLNVLQPARPAGSKEPARHREEDKSRTGLPRRSGDLSAAARSAKAEAAKAGTIRAQRSPIAVPA